MQFVLVQNGEYFIIAYKCYAYYIRGNRMVIYIIINILMVGVYIHMFSDVLYHIYIFFIRLCFVCIHGVLHKFNGIFRVNSRKILNAHNKRLNLLCSYIV